MRYENDVQSAPYTLSDKDNTSAALAFVVGDVKRVVCEDSGRTVYYLEEKGNANEWRYLTDEEIETFKAAEAAGDETVQKPEIKRGS